MGLSQGINQDGRNNEEEGKMRKNKPIFFSLLQFILLNSGPSPLDEAIAVATYSLSCQQWTMEESRAGEGAGLCFSEARKATLKVKAGSAVGGSCERAAKGSCAREGVWEGNSGTAVSDNSFSET